MPSSLIAAKLKSWPFDREAFPSIITFLINTRRVKEESLVCRYMLQHYRHNVAGLGKAGFAMSDYPATLQVPGVKPGIDQNEVLAAVINLPVLEPRRPPILENRHVFVPSIPYFSQILCHMNGRIRFVTDT